jgi:AsmA protein
VTVATGLKRLGYLVAAIIVVGFGSLALMSLLISADTVRESVKSELRGVTGLDLTLRGNASVSLFPTGSVSFDEVVLGVDSSREPALAADRVIARLRLLPLLIGRIDIADVALENPRINVNFGNDGRSNWSGLIDSLSRALGPRAVREGRSASFSEIRVRSGTIVVTDSTRGIAETLSNVDMALAWPSISKSFAATGRLEWHGERLDVSATLGDFSSALMGERSGFKVRVNGAPITLAFDGQISVLPTVKVEGTLAANAASLRETLRWLGQKPLPGGGFGRFALKASTSVTSGMVSLTSVNVELDGNAAEGVLTFVTNARQTLQGTLAADDLDLTPYVSTIRLATSNDRDWNELPIALDGMNGFDLDLRLSAAKITIARAKLGKTAGAANLRSGKLTVTVAESNAFGGIVKGSFMLGATDLGADIKAQMQFSDVDLQSCLSELFNIRQVEGRGNLALNFDTSGSSILGMTQNINGTINLVGRDGSISRFNVEQVLQRLRRQPLSGPPRELRNGRTVYEKLIVNIKIAQGNAVLEEARLEGPKLAIIATGTSAIPTRELDLKGSARLFDTVRNDTATPSLDLPFMVRGSWDDPLPLFDTQVLINLSRGGRGLLPPTPPAAAPNNDKPATEPATAPAPNQ